MDVPSIVSLSAGALLLLFAMFSLYSGKLLGGFLSLLFGTTLMLLSTPAGNRIREMTYRSKMFSTLQLTLSEQPPTISEHVKRAIANDVVKAVSTNAPPNITLDPQAVESNSKSVASALTEQLLEHGWSATNPFGSRPRIDVGTVYTQTASGEITPIEQITLSKDQIVQFSVPDINTSVPGDVNGPAEQISCDHVYSRSVSQFDLMQALNEANIVKRAQQTYIVSTVVACETFTIHVHVPFRIAQVPFGFTAGTSLSHAVLGYKAFRINMTE